jgi:hypothetical protein
MEEVVAALLVHWLALHTVCDPQRRSRVPEGVRVSYSSGWARVHVFHRWQLLPFRK